MKIGGGRGLGGQHSLVISIGKPRDALAQNIDARGQNAEALLLILFVGQQAFERLIDRIKRLISILLNDLVTHLDCHG